MKITALGIGSAFAIYPNFQSNFLIEKDGKKLLVDAGSDVRHALNAQNLSYRDIDAVYISHLHTDHAGGIEYLAFCSYFDPTKNKIDLYGHYDVLTQGWENTWSGGLASIQGRRVVLDDYFCCSRLSDNGSFIWQGIEFFIVQTVHIMNGYAIVPSYGLIFKDPDSLETKTIYMTSDTQFNPNQIRDFYNKADVIIQDCETAPYKSGVHAHITELQTLAPEIKAKMCLTHYQPNLIKNEEVKEMGFLGLCQPGIIYDSEK
jgi:ribonuclease BN (tRNA processing enzyme)